MCQEWLMKYNYDFCIKKYYLLSKYLALSKILTRVKFCSIIKKNTKGGDSLSTDLNIKLRIMQDNLCDLRRIAGWTTEALANKLGITKQTISNIENNKVNLSRIQYIAIRAVFECQVSMNRDNITLREIYDLLFDIIPFIYEENKDEIRAAVTAIASVASSGLSNLQLYSSTVALLAPLGKLISLKKTIKSADASLDWLIEELVDGSPEINIDYCSKEDGNEEG